MKSFDKLSRLGRIRRIRVLAKVALMNYGVTEEAGRTALIPFLSTHPKLGLPLQSVCMTQTVEAEWVGDQ